MHVACDGAQLTGLQAVTSHIMRWGSAPHGFDPEIAAAA